MPSIENARIYAPAEDPNKPEDRVVLHPETNIEQVLTRGNKTLKDDIGGKTVFGTMEAGLTNPVIDLGREVLQFEYIQPVHKIFY